ncbi:MAG: NAD-dependent malic enzyme [Deltaproteobacteria bacterium]|nr:NAD-dependent malic enzyme [Deltaproteobacteria bacterium]
MSKHSVDYVLRLKLQHRIGQLARVAQCIAEQGALVGEIATVADSEELTIRDFTVETESDVIFDRLKNAVGKLDGVKLLEVIDPVADAHVGGKIRVVAERPVDQVRALRHVYTPGVARIVRRLQKTPSDAWSLTGIGRTVGVFSNGTRVLGLGDTGTLASLPVMEGKALLYAQLAGLNAFPLVLDAKTPEKFVEVVMAVAPSVGGIHLEDIKAPDCFAIEDELSRRLKKPVMHDDQHGTATATLAAVINACDRVGKDPRELRVGQIGLGAAGSAIALLLLHFRVRDVLVHDLSPAAVARATMAGAASVNIEHIMRECDVVIAATGKEGLIPARLVRKGQIIFALSNPKPEISPWDALDAGAAIASDGASINNALAFPGLFMGALHARARSITKGMLVAAAEQIASHAEKDALLPSVLNKKMHEAVASDVQAEAQASGLADTAELS